MNYQTTRSKSTKKITSGQSILKGLGEDLGLFVPESIPKLSQKEIEAMVNISYQEKASKILGLYLTDFTPEEIDHCVHSAYNENTFNAKDITPLHKLSDTKHVMELYHGPTLAFKDVALQILPHLLITSAKKNNDQRNYVILVATSGDTGKAALEGFKDVPNTQVLVFYPDGGVSKIQKLQMATQKGDNVFVTSVVGNFDDTQSGVKEIFSNKDVNTILESNNFTFSSANSINWGRLVPQIVYYFQGYLDLVKNKEITMGESINFCVPTGNFGNILAGYMAKEMGLPIKKLICAANENNVLTDFIESGFYDKNRDFKKTISPSMDILISSNLERMLYFASEGNHELVKELMYTLKKYGNYEVPETMKAQMQGIFFSSYATDAETKETIKEVFSQDNYLIDTHTGVALNVYDKYVAKTNDHSKTIILSTASPFKFNQAVAQSILSPETDFNDEINLLSQVSQIANIEIPKSLKNLDQEEVRFKGKINKEEMLSTLLEVLNLS